MKDKNDKIFLIHIMESCENIKDFSNNLKKLELGKNRMKQSAIVRELEIIGEAVKQLPISFTTKYPYIEWSKIAGMRDKLIHHYFGVDLDMVEEVIKKDIPILKKEVENILKELK
jgi:uncharacterized protein with HEPN domain